MNTIQNLCRQYLKTSGSNRLRLISLCSLLLIWASGCTSQNSTPGKSKSQAGTPKAVNSPESLNSTATQLKLIVDYPETLRVKKGDLIVKGQILVDRSAARQQIAARRQKLQQEAALFATTEEIQVSPADTTTMTAQVTQARERVRLAEAAIKDFLAKSPYTDAARQTLPLPHEEKQLAQLQLAKSTAQDQLEQAISQLNSVKSAQQARQQVQTDSSGKKKQLLNELQTIETQLQALQDILSPHDAIVTEIEWQKKGKQGTAVELSLAVHSSTDPALPLSSSPDDPLLSVPKNTPALPTGSQPFSNPPTNPAAPLLPKPPPQAPAAKNN